jgi:hypothetical protein
MTGTQLSGAVWRRSSRSGSNANCVEVAALVAVADSGGRAAGTTVVAVRDSKDVDGPVLAFAATAWRSFVTATRRHRLG